MTPQIIAIMLVRNEDRFLRRAAMNILGFCDRILIADHQSQDATPEICEELARTSPKFEIYRIRDPRESHEMLVPLANTKTWVFGVDGDEIYDPAGLARVRQRLHAGEWDKWWVVFGNVLNCDALDETARTASGWFAPPCRSMTKLYNFAAVERLDPATKHRLHGKNNVFNPGWDASVSRWELYKETPWEQSEFRDENTSRRNVTESLGLRNRLRAAFARMLGRKSESDYKAEKYRRGEYATVDATQFLKCRMTDDE
jgi:Glycosyl transferase family 2